MNTVKLCRLLAVLALGSVSFAALAYPSNRDFSGASDGAAPALVSDYGQTLDFGFSSPSDPGAYGLRALSGQGAAGYAAPASAGRMSRSQPPPSSRELEEFNRDFYGAR